jgi:hypothetical protein
MSLLSRKPKTGRRSLKRSRRGFLEVLEQRLLLFSDPFFSAHEWPAAVDLELFVENSAAGEILTLVDRSSKVALASAPLSDISGPVRMVGLPHDDTLLLALQPLYVNTHLPQRILFDGGAGTDTLLGPSDDATWNITGPNSGNLGGPGIVEFSSVENLTGHADNEDTFVVTATSHISGVIGGGAGGFDSIVLDGGTFDSVTYTAFDVHSGTNDRDGAVLTYAGLEPITDTSTVADRVISTAGTAPGELPDVGLLGDDVDDRATLTDNGNGTLTLAPESPFFTFESVTVIDPIVNGQDGKAEVVIAGAVVAKDVTISAEKITVSSNISATPSTLGNTLDASLLTILPTAAITFDNTTLTAASLTARATVAVTAAFEDDADDSDTDTTSDAAVTVAYGLVDTTVKSRPRWVQSVDHRSCVSTTQLSSIYFLIPHQFTDRQACRRQSGYEGSP